MKLSLSVRIAEAACKTKLNAPLSDLLDLAVANGYDAICMRASAAGVQTSLEQRQQMAAQVQAAGLPVSMVTADFDVPLNNDAGPNSLRNIGPSLDVAEAFQCDLVRVCLKSEADIAAAQSAADEAAERGIRLAHQCHTTTMFEQVEPSIAVLERINRPNFGLIYEPANLMLCGEPYGLEVLRRFQPYLMNVYLQNHRLDPLGPASLETWCGGDVTFHHIPLWEEGGVDFAIVMSALAGIGYQGCITVHQHFAHLMGPTEAAVKSAEFLRRWE